MKVTSDAYFAQVSKLLQVLTPDDGALLAEVQLLSNLCRIMNRRAGALDMFEFPTDLRDVTHVLDSAWRVASLVYQLSTGFSEVQRLVKRTHGTVKRLRGALASHGLCTPCPAPAPRVPVTV